MKVINMGTHRPSPENRSPLIAILAILCIIIICMCLTSCRKSAQKTVTPIQQTSTPVQKKWKVIYKLHAGYYPCRRTAIFPDSTVTTDTLGAGITTTFYIPQSVTKRMFQLVGSIVTNDSVFTEIWINDTLRSKNKGGNASNSTVYF